MSWLRLIGTHLHLASNIVDFGDAVAEAGVTGIPDGGAEGQALVKDSAGDGDATWHNIEDIATAETDDTLVLAPDGIGGVEFVAAAAPLPTGGTTGQALVKDSGADGDATWHDIQDLATTELDDTKVLAPDGVGGVEFRAPAAGGGSGLVFTAITPVTIKTLTALGDEATWTDIDVSAHVSSACRLIQIKIRMVYLASSYVLYLRRNGTAEANDPDHSYGIISASKTSEFSTFNFPIDSNHIFEYYWDRFSGSGNASDAIITLLGYWD